MQTSEIRAFLGRRMTALEPDGARPRGLYGPMLFGVLILLIIVTGGLSRASQSAEAYQRAMVAQDLLDGSSRGRQGLVGSLSLAPLPTIVISLMAVMPYVTPSAYCGAFIAGVSALLLCLYTNRMWAREGISPWLRYPAIACILFMPPVARSMETGQTTMLFVALVVCGWGFLTYWLRRFDLRDLAYASLLLGLAVGVRYQAAFLVVIALALVVLATALERHSFALLEGTGITFAIPALYVLLLWIGGNWLILGNPVFFLHGLANSIGIGVADMRAILTTNCEWVVLAAVTLLVLSVPAAGMLSKRTTGGPLRHGVAFGALTASVILVLATGVAGVRMSDARVPAAVAALEKQFPNGSFIVTGYEGYEFEAAAGKRNDEKAWIHLMHLEPSRLDKILLDFRGREIYLLVNTEMTVERWDDVGLEWRGPHSRIPEHFIYVERIGPWLVFEVIRTDEPLLVTGQG